MADEPKTSGTEDASPDGDATDDRTVEAVEAEYRARISGKDRAHAVEKAALEARIASLTADKQKVVPVADTDVLRTENETLKADLEKERRERAIEARKARFPNAAESLGDDHVATMDEERLAALEQRLGAPAPVTTEPGRVLSNTQGRTLGGEKPIADKTRDELLADLERMAPAFTAEIAQRG